MTTGQYIKELRLQKGMTQEDLAAKTDTTARTIQRIENDEVDPRAYTLQNIAAAFEVHFDVLNNINKLDSHEEPDGGSIWLPILHLSGLFILLLPPLAIWVFKKNDVKGIDEHARHVVNFQLSMLLYMIPCGILSILIIPIVILIGLALFSTGIIILNTIKVFNGQAYKYPLAINILAAKV
ncbi:helix-turn-helix domain-containing protein [Daejeonella sp.]|uniref:helix-turn-helix domain-containing protein n=1 Tax=Daejeonella sp. TaxID=2805397 RepID=UPI0030C2600A